MQAMDKIIKFAGCSALYILLIGSVSCSAVGEREDFGAWFEPGGENKELIKSMLNAQNKRIPTKEEVSIPRYPNSKIFYVESPIDLQIVDLHKEIKLFYRPIVLVSTSPAYAVAKWYEEKLHNYSKFEVDGIIYFFDGVVKEFIPSTHQDMLYRQQHVIVKRIDPETKKIAPSYSTIIEIVYDVRNMNP